MSENRSREHAEQMVMRCPSGYWVVDDRENGTVYYKNQKSPHDTIATDYTTDHVLIAHQVFLPPADKYHIAFGQARSSEQQAQTPSLLTRVVSDPRPSRACWMDQRAAPITW